MKIAPFLTGSIGESREYNVYEKVGKPRVRMIVVDASAFLSLSLESLNLLHIVQAGTPQTRLPTVIST